jgi:hypothetical protein
MASLKVTIHFCQMSCLVGFLCVRGHCPLAWHRLCSMNHGYDLHLEMCGHEDRVWTVPGWDNIYFPSLGQNEGNLCRQEVAERKEEAR